MIASHVTLDDNEKCARFRVKLTDDAFMFYFGAKLKNTALVTHLQMSNLLRYIETLPEVEACCTHTPKDIKSNTIGDWLYKNVPHKHIITSYVIAFLVHSGWVTYHLKGRRIWISGR